MEDDRELTEDGYPTDAALERIERAGTPREALELAERAWHWRDFASRELRPEEALVVDAEPGDEFVRFATGGWSGNESIIRALNENFMVRAMCWEMTARGGLHIYKLPKTPDAVDPPATDPGTPSTRD